MGMGGKFDIRKSTQQFGHMFAVRVISSHGLVKETNLMYVM